MIEPYHLESITADSDFGPIAKLLLQALGRWEMFTGITSVAIVGADFLDGHPRIVFIGDIAAENARESFDSIIEAVTTIRNHFEDSR